MKRDIVVYGLSTAINKGSILLFFPIIIQFLTLADFGRWSLAMICVNLLLPIVSFNGAAGILREGSTDKKVGGALVCKFTLLTILFGGGLGLVSYALELEAWVFYCLLIAAAEAMLLLSLTYLRTVEQPFVYLAVVSAKVLVLLGMIIYASQHAFSLVDLLQYHFFIILCFAILVFCILLLKFDEGMGSTVSFQATLLFSIAFIPHGLSQWVMSSSDRIILEYMLGSEVVGVYSIAYSLAMVLMLMNSGLAMALPTYLIKRHEKWFATDMDNVLIRYYTLLSAGLFVFIYVIYLLDQAYFFVLGFYGQEMVPLLIIIYLSIYVLGLYYFYANHLFYHRKAGAISKATLLAAALNIVLTCIFIVWIGVIGAALATLVAYIFYVWLMRREAQRVEPNMDINVLRKEGLIFVMMMMMILFSSIVQGL